LPTRALARKPYRRSSIDSSHEYIVAPAINELSKNLSSVFCYDAFLMCVRLQLGISYSFQCATTAFYFLRSRIAL